MQRVTKGNHQNNHIVLIEGNPDIEAPGNMLYYFDQHMTKTIFVGLRDLLHHHVAKVFGNNDKIWPWNKTCMSMKLRYTNIFSVFFWVWSNVSLTYFVYRYRAYLAGYADKMFSFHSLRSGMLFCFFILFRFEMKRGEERER